MTNTYKYIVALAIYCFAAAGLHAQCYMVQKKDGTYLYYTMSEMRNITLYGHNNSEKTATVTLTAGDVWGDNSGYQMLIDADATAFGTIFNDGGSLTSSGDADASIYNQFEYKIPENADGATNTRNIILNNSTTITIPAGTYDWCITNPTPGDRIWIAGGNGNIAARQNDYVFEAGKKYEFTMSRFSNGDGVDVSVTSTVETGICINKADGTTIKVPTDDIDYVTFLETDNPERVQILSCKANDVQYTLYKKADKAFSQLNPDKSVFYKSQLTLDITENGSTSTYVVDNDLYLIEDVNPQGWQTQCIAIDLNARLLYIFTNEKTRSNNYFMNGFCYVSSLDNINFKRETVFSEDNWGWHPYFAYYNGELSVQHFSYRGYYSMTSIRNSDGSWSTQQGIHIQPDKYIEELWRMFGPVLIIGEETSDTHEYVDLGLPSGTLWATCNVGADTPEGYGHYFAWGETEPKSDYTWETYAFFGAYDASDNALMTKYCTMIKYGYNGFCDRKSYLDPEDDAATVNWGSEWQMPDEDQIDELIDDDYTTTSWTTQNGIVGCKITSNSNGNSIFLPAAGYANYTDILGIYGCSCLYTTAQNAYCLIVSEDENEAYASINRCCGFTIRPVRVRK